MYQEPLYPCQNYQSMYRDRLNLQEYILHHKQQPYTSPDSYYICFPPTHLYWLRASTLMYHMHPKALLLQNQAIVATMQFQHLSPKHVDYPFYLNRISLAFPWYALHLQHYPWYPVSSVLYSPVMRLNVNSCYPQYHLHHIFSLLTPNPSNHSLHLHE